MFDVVSCCTDPNIIVPNHPPARAVWRYMVLPRISSSMYPTILGCEDLTNPMTVALQSRS
jgi:hypothetical protein